MCVLVMYVCEFGAAKTLVFAGRTFAAAADARAFK